MRHTAAALALAMTGAALVGNIASASDRVGVYAIVDRVEFEPSADRPDRIKIWGAFAVATRNDHDLYDAVQRGYLYFTVAADRAQTRTEWNDMKTLAGTKRIVAFGSRFGLSVRVRPESEAPQAPDTYSLGAGVHPVQNTRTDYPPIKALAAQITR
jgi:hypothetical protein